MDRAQHIHGRQEAPPRKTRAVVAFRDPGYQFIYLCIDVGGKPKLLLQMGLAGQVRLFISDAIMDEMLEVLETKFEHPPKRLAEARDYVAACTVRCVPKVRLNVVKDDEDDNRIVECAVHSRSEVIITNDGDLLRMKEYNGIRIMKVHEFLRGTGLAR